MPKANFDERLRAAISRAPQVAVPPGFALSGVAQDPLRICSLAYVEDPSDLYLTTAAAAILADFRARVAERGKTPADFAPLHLASRASVPIDAYFGGEIDGIPVRWTMHFQILYMSYAIAVDAELLPTAQAATDGK